MDLFGRTIELWVGEKLIPEILTVYFDVDFDDSEGVNPTKITVYNLSEQTISGIKVGSRLTLSAGYQSDIGVISESVIKASDTRWQGVDKITEINCIDGVGNYLSAKVSKTFAPGTAASVVLRYLIGEAGLGIGDLSPPVDFVYRNGKTVKGNVSDHLKSVVKDCKAKMHIHRDRIFIRDSTKGDNIGFVVNKDSGLIDEPEKIMEEITDKKTSKKTTRIGWKLKMLLNHRLTADSVIVLQSRKATGNFRVAKGKHTSNGSSFYTEVEVF